MRLWLLITGVLISVILAGCIGYWISAVQYREENNEREKQLHKEISLLLSSLADIAHHRSHGETEIADWKFDQLHGNLEDYVRAGGGAPSQFIYDIVEATEIPDDDESDNGEEE